MFSGGQRQRIALARAMMLQPKVLVADEPTSALDVSIQAQVLNLFMDLQQQFRTAYVFISHNLAVVRHVADDVLVMYLGRPAEMGPADKLYENPLHPYTRALLSATPAIHPDPTKPKIRIQGELPNPLNPPEGCAFHSAAPTPPSAAAARCPSCACSTSARWPATTPSNSSAERHGALAARSFRAGAARQPYPNPINNPPKPHCCRRCARGRDASQRPGGHRPAHRRSRRPGQPEPGPYRARRTGRPANRPRG